MKNLFAILALLIFLLSTSAGQTKRDDETVKRIETYLAEIEKVGFYGSVLVEINGEKVISKGYGFRDKDRSLKNTPTTIFDIGSITKQFTAAAILKLEMQGKLSTDDKLSKYFDDVPKDKEGITIHDLLRHQSGLQSSIGKDYDKISKAAFINTVLRSPLRFANGTKFSYSNIGYSILAIIIEKVTGSTYEDYLYENLWNPAQMNSTGYTRPNFDKNLIAVGYDRNDKAWGKPTDKEWDTNAPYWHLAGNGGILTTTEDLYKWHQALQSERILSKEAKRKLYNPRLRADENENPHYAYGWDVFKTDRNTLRVWHNGTNGVFYADFLRFLDDRVTSIVLSNKSHANFDGLNREISKMIFDKNYRPGIPVADNQANRNFTHQIIDTIQHSGLNSAKQLYKERNKDVNLLQFEMRNNGFRSLDEKKPELAISIFEMNLLAFPDSAKAFQDLAEAYMESGNKESAIANFRRSLSIESENPFAADMLKRLEK